MFKYLSQIWNSKDLRKKILFTVGIIVIYRLIAHITVPGANTESLKAFASRNELLQMFSLLTGGSTENFSIVLMGISPYINASIIIQLLTVVIPKLESISKEGEMGRRRLNSYTRWLTLPLAFLQSYGMIVLLNSQTQIPIIENINNPATILPIMLTISAGTILLVWMGEQITENGIGNGISLLIFTGIISSIPQMVGQNLFLAQGDESKIIPFIVVTLLTIILTTIVILVTEAARLIPITYAGRGIRAKSDQASLPIRINQAGMIPIIFAVALVSFPGIIGQFLVNASSPWLRTFGASLTTLFQPNTILYLTVYFLLVVAFTFFYVSITFNPEQVAENIQKRGGYIPGIRPGVQTADYLRLTSGRLTFFGATFLGLIAVLPILIQYLFKSTSIGTVSLLISGAGIIIIVGVVLDLIRQTNAQLQMHDYGKFY
ncbi:preprotein translocase subunit SecY [Candidatus Peregrinibacteria bacterium RIFCSPLOWO2_02_FULL_39_10]|nr:MAG: preprotein translocase subunit SecY [Candidatus Peregrinibacteria bacterium RIFCSPLOWO2_02_FULL_39_10]